MTERVEVKFGANTSELDAKSKKAEQDIKGVAQAASGVKGVLGSVGQAFSRMFGGVKGAAQEATGHMRLVGSSIGNLRLRLSEGIESMKLFGEAMLAAFAVEKVYEFFHGIVEWAENMANSVVAAVNASQRLGMSVQQISQWNAVAMSVNMTTEQMQMGFTRLERAMVQATNGGRQQSAAFRTLGVDITSVHSPSEALLRIADRFKEMPDGPRKTALAMTLMGRAGASMIPILNQGSEALREMFRESDEYGATMSRDMVAAGLQVHDAMHRMELATQGLKNTLFTALAPAITTVINGLAGMIHAMVDSYRTGGIMRTVLDYLVTAIKAVGIAAVIMGTAFVMAFETARAAVDGLIGGVLYLKDLMTGGHSSDSWLNSASQAGHNALNAPGAGAGMIGTIMHGGPPGHAPPGSNPDMDMEIPGSGRGGHGHRNNAAMEAWLADMKFRQEMARDDAVEQERIQAEMVQRIGQYYGLQSKEYADALRDQIRMRHQHQDQQFQIELEGKEASNRLELEQVDVQRQYLGIRLEDQRQHLQEQENLGQISARQRIVGLRAILDAELAAETTHQEDMYHLRLAALQEELLLDNIRPEETRRINREIEALEQQHANAMRLVQRRYTSDVERLNAQMLQANVNRWKSIVTPITGAMNNIFNGLMEGTQSWRSLMSQALLSVVNEFAQRGFEMLAHWAAMELAKTTTTTVGVAARTTAEAAGAATTTGISAASALVQIAHSAAVAAARVYAAIAAIPIVGPFLAPAMAAAALVAVIALGAKIAHASQGYDIPAGVNPLTQLHSEEMVLPANIAKPLRQSLRLGPRGGGFSALAGMSAAAGSSARSDGPLRGSEGGDHYHIHTMDRRGLEDFLRGNRRIFNRVVKGSVRDGIGG